MKETHRYVKQHRRLRPLTRENKGKHAPGLLVYFVSRSIIIKGWTLENPEPNLTALSGSEDHG